MGQHIGIKKRGGDAIVWDTDEERLFSISGDPETVDAVCRFLRASETALEHELSQRGANRAAFVDDLTAEELAAIAKAKADADAAAKAKADAEATASEAERLLAVIERAKAAIEALSAPAPAAPAPAVGALSADLGGTSTS